MSHSTHPKSHSVVTSTDVLDDAKALGVKVTALVGPAPALTTADVRRSTKLRKGGEGVIPTLAALSEQQGLVIPSHPTATMTEKLAQAQSLVALHKQMVLATKQIGDTMFLAESQSWDAATVHYSMLRPRAEERGPQEGPGSRDPVLCGPLRCRQGGGEGEA
jgi:hypothetical protein